MRIATLPEVEVSVSVQYFTPAGPASQVSTYTLHSDANGNAYLYGSFVKKSTVSVKYGNAVLASYTFGKASEDGKSYVLDATVVSLEGMSGDSTKIMEAIEAEVKRGNKDIRLMLPYDLDMAEADGILGGLDGLDAGSINLTLMGCEKIAFQGFKNCKQLKSVTLPDVTEICESAFAACSRLQKVVFGTPLKKVYGDPETFGGGVFLKVATLKGLIWSCQANRIRCPSARSRGKMSGLLLKGSLIRDVLDTCTVNFSAIRSCL